MINSNNYGNIFNITFNNNFNFQNKKIISTGPIIKVISIFIYK